MKKNYPGESAADFFDAVKQIMAEARAKYPEYKDSNLDTNGEIFYMNGNDSTKFDWEVNDRLCEFMIFHKDEMGFIKVCADTNGNIDGYIYKAGSMSPDERFTCSISKDAVYDAYEWISEHADGLDLWDKSLDELKVPSNSRGLSI